MGHTLFTEAEERRGPSIGHKADINWLIPETALLPVTAIIIVYSWVKRFWSVLCAAIRRL